MAVGYNFAQLCTKVYQLLNEGELVPTTDNTFPNPPANSKWPLYLLQNDLNTAQNVYVSATGVAPAIMEKYLVTPVAAGLDYTLPSDLVALTRIEYLVTGQGPFKILQKTFDEFDQITATGYALTDTGYPECFREPFGTPKTIRLFPYPTASNVTAGDQLAIYYSTAGTSMVNATDMPSVPGIFHEAIFAYVLARYWRLKNDTEMASLYAQDWKMHVDLGKQYADNLNRGHQTSISDEEDTEGGDYLLSYR